MKPRRKLALDLTDLMARILHYQEHGEPDFDTAKEYMELPDVIVSRYRNNARFKAQVDRAVVLIMDRVSDTASGEQT